MERLSKTNILITDEEKQILDLIKETHAYKLSVGGVLLGLDSEIKIWFSLPLFKSKYLEAFNSLINKGVIERRGDYEIKINYIL